MRKEIIKVSMLGMIAIVMCGMLLYVSCKPKCTPDCGLTQSEQDFFSCYNNVEKIFFKNDSTNAIDTLIIPGGYESGCSGPCINCPDYEQTVYGCFDYHITFSLFGKFKLRIGHDQPPDIVVSGYKVDYFYILNTQPQAININGTSYNDVYSVQSSPDSVTIDTNNNDKQKIPWKIDYSKSQGFVRFYMLNRQTWTKQ